MHTPKAQSKDGWEINGPASAFTHRTSQAFDGSTTPSPLCNNTEPSRTLTTYSASSKRLPMFFSGSAAGFWARMSLISLTFFSTESTVSW